MKSGTDYNVPETGFWISYVVCVKRRSGQQLGIKYVLVISALLYRENDPLCQTETLGPLQGRKGNAHKNRTDVIVSSAQVPRLVRAAVLGYEQSTMRSA